MAGIENEDVEPLNLYFTDRSSLYEGWDDSDMYDFTESFNSMSLKPWIKQNETNMVNNKMSYFIDFISI